VVVEGEGSRWRPATEGIWRTAGRPPLPRDDRGQRRGVSPTSLFLSLRGGERELQGRQRHAWSWRGSPLSRPQYRPGDPKRGGSDSLLLYLDPNSERVDSSSTSVLGCSSLASSSIGGARATAIRGRSGSKECKRRCPEHIGDLFCHDPNRGVLLLSENERGGGLSLDHELERGVSAARLYLEV